MWRSFWRTIDRFSLQYFKYILNELRGIKVVDKHNRELVVDILQSIVEIVTYGDRHDPLIFECFMEYQVLAEFVRVLKIGRNSRIEAPLLQYLSIMIQNMDSEHAIYYCLSNDYINSIISHQYEFDGGDLAPYYVSFLRAVSGKINRDTLCLLVKVQGDIVISFPLYSEAIKFAQHEEKMIQAAVRALTLNVFNVSDDMVSQFITTPPLSNYFSDLVQSLRKQCFNLDSLVHSTQETCIHEKKNELLVETDKLVDDLYYLKDILSVGESRLIRSVTHNLLSVLVFPILFSLLQLRPSNGLNLSAVSSLYIVSRLLQVVGGKKLFNSVACVILYPYMISRTRGAPEGGTADTINHDNSFFNHLNEMEELVCPSPGSEGAENISRNFLFGHLADRMPCSVHFDICFGDNVCMERSGILSYIFSNNHSLLLASIFLLVILAESKDLDYLLASLVGLNGMQEMRTHDMSASGAAEGSIFVSFMPQIFDALLRVLASQPPCSVLVQWHTGWFLRKLLVFYRKRLSDHNLNLFKTSYEQSRERLQKELDEYWFDNIPDTLRNEWASCKTALEESSQHRDPLFSLELAVCQKTTNGNTTYLAWQRMVDAVKAFILHLQLKAFITKGDLLENPPLGNFANSPSTDLGRSHLSDPSSASFGSEVVLGSGIPCKIAFPNLGIRDIYVIPVAREISGKLLLAEKHPFRSQRGIVIAIAPLAGLSPKKDEDHPTWLHLQIREFDPRFDRPKTRDYHSKISNHAADGRWTLGFPNAEACEAVRLLILTETCKQRSFVESMLAPLLKNNFLGQSEDLYV